jgi:hypothetical protein
VAVSHGWGGAFNVTLCALCVNALRRH